jgi:hypothetical protein
MPLFMCRDCGCVENTALGSFWSRNREGKAPGPQCSECHTGKWHGEFKKKSAVGALVDSDGFLWFNHESLPRNKNILGCVLPQISKGE